MNIPVYRLPFSDSDIAFVNSKIVNILRSGYLTDGGETVKEFETSWSEFIGCDYSVSVNSCTTGLEAVLSSIDIRDQSVIVPNYTFYASPMSVINKGGHVIFADISRDTLSITLESIKAVIRGDTKAVMIVHVGGVISDEIFEIREYCDDNGLTLIEDAACATGSTFKGRAAGTFGHAGVFSLHHSKVLTTGEGGMICTDDKTLATRLRKVRAIGLDRDVNNWEVFCQGSNYKMSEITAALGLLQLKNASNIIDERRRIASFYDTAIQWRNGVYRFRPSTDMKSSYYKYIIRINEPWKKAEIKSRLLEDYNIAVPPSVYDYNCNSQNFSKHSSIVNSGDAFPTSEYMSDHHMCLNMYNGLTKEELTYIVDSFNETIEKL